MYDDILFPVDEVDAAGDALGHAAAIADWAGATVHLLYVADTTRDSVTVTQSGVVDALVREGESVVAEAGDRLEALGVAFDTAVVQGSPAATIADYAAEYGHDAVVMPTHARSGLPRYLLGSVTEKVVRLSPVPVLTVRMREDEELTFPYERILVPTDGSEAATAAADHALSLARALNATVDALSVVEDAALGPDVRSAVSESAAESGAREAVDAVADAGDERDVTVVTHVAHGRPAEEIRAAVASTGAHAVVVGATGRSGLDRLLLGSVAARTVRTSPVPVVTVRSD